MKFLAFLIVLAGVGMVGSTFFGIYTVPGLEGLPTVESLGLKDDEAKSKKSGASGATGTETGTKGVFRTNSSGAAAKRRNQLNQNQGQVAPGS